MLFLTKKFIWHWMGRFEMQMETTTALAKPVHKSQNWTTLPSLRVHGCFISASIKGKAKRSTIANFHQLLNMTVLSFSNHTQATGLQLAEATPKDTLSAFTSSKANPTTMMTSKTGVSFTILAQGRWTKSHFYSILFTSEDHLCETNIFSLHISIIHFNSFSYKIVSKNCLTLQNIKKICLLIYI